METSADQRDVGVTVRSDEVVHVDRNFAVILRAIIIFRTDIDAIVEALRGPDASSDTWQELTRGIFGRVDTRDLTVLNPEMRIVVSGEDGDENEFRLKDAGMITDMECVARYSAVVTTSPVEMRIDWPRGGVEYVERFADASEVRKAATLLW